MQSSITWKTLPFALATCILSGALIAVADPPHTPPPEAFSACISKQQGDKCVVQLVGREIGGICSSGPEQQLFCRPDHLPTRGPPPEALAACTSKSAGDACSMQFPDGSLRSGVCRAGTDDRMACVPAGPPPRP